MMGLALLWLLPSSMLMPQCFQRTVTPFAPLQSSLRRSGAVTLCTAEGDDADDFATEAARVQAVVAEANAARKRQRRVDPVDHVVVETVRTLGAVDVDLSLSLNRGGAGDASAEADEVFDVFDLDGDEPISLEQCHALLAPTFSNGEIDRMFEALDLNSDGVISRLELREAFGRYEHTATRLALGLAVGSQSVADSDARGEGSHELSPPPLEGQAPHDAARRAALADELFDEIDTNSDGTVSEGELRLHLERQGYSRSTVEAIFAALDLNADGEVSRAELRHSFSRSRHSALLKALGV